MFGSVVEFIKGGRAFVAFITALLIGSIIAMVIMFRNLTKKGDEEENY